MTDESYPPPPPPSSPPSPPRTVPTGPSQRVPRALIAGVIVLGVLAAILLILVLTRDADGTASSSSTPTPSTSATASASAGETASAAPSATATASADAPTQPQLAQDSVVATTVDRLTVRSAPGLSGERLGTLESGALSFVAGGPTDADGLRWYLISGLGLPPNTGCAGDPETDPYNCPIWFGWAAAASEAGDPYLVEHDLACPDEPLTAEGLALGRTALERLACFGSEPITFRGWWPEIPDDAGLGGACASQDKPSGWLLCQNINYNLILIDESEHFFGVGVRVSIDPDSDAAMPERGTWVEVRVHLDDPAAQTCGEDAGAESELESQQIVLNCRAEMVLEAAQAVDGP
jgi:hypothetical protein